MISSDAMGVRQYWTLWASGRALHNIRKEVFEGGCLSSPYEIWKSNILLSFVSNLAFLALRFMSWNINKKACLKIHLYLV